MWIVVVMFVLFVEVVSVELLIIEFGVVLFVCWL